MTEVDSSETDTNEIDVMPTKAFFVDMLVRDIPLDRAIMDLVDNCIDGAKRLRGDAPGAYKGLYIDIKISRSSFSIEDNCGGFSSDTAKKYAFRFGREPNAKYTDHSIGQFGVGMKRALFKFGRHFTVRSVTETELWSVEVPVTKWLTEKKWTFPFEQLKSRDSTDGESVGTKITVTELRPDTEPRFGAPNFITPLIELIQRYHRQFIANGIDISINDRHLVATEVNILTGSLTPEVKTIEFPQEGKATVTARITAGLGDSKPEEAGWYIICNGRIILAADRDENTGWGDQANNPNNLPKFHSQYYRFRGTVFFDCADAERLPWNTSKTGVDVDSAIWRATLEQMLIIGRKVINFLNKLDAEIDEFGVTGSPLAAAISAARPAKVETVTATATFGVSSGFKAKPSETMKISYHKPRKQIDALMTALSLKSAKAVGETTFDMVYKDI